jgi:hypothetical protein
MSANPKPDLQDVKSKFDSFRADRKGKKELPENLWAEAVALLDHYPFQAVWRELRLKPEYLKRRAGMAKDNEAPKRERSPKFLTLTSSELAEIKNDRNKKIAAQSVAAQCRLVIDRGDGSRLELNLPVDWPRIEALCSSFLRG